MAISKSTPYVRYKKDFTSSLHLGTIHIESEYLDRTQKTTIESIHGMTWHNKVVNENKELNLLSDTQLELTELEKQYWNTGEKRVSVDEIHTLEEVEPNEDGTYTYMVNSMEGEYIEIYDGINNITSTSDGLDGQFEIVYDTTEEDINGNIALDSIVPQYEITDSGVGTITGAKSTGLTLVNHITESSKEEVVVIEQQEGQHFTINNTVEGNIKSAILKGQTLVNLTSYTRRNTGGVSNIVLTDGKLTWTTNSDWQKVYFVINGKPNTKYIVKYHSINENIGIYYRLDTTSDSAGNAYRIYNSNKIFTSGTQGVFIVSLERGSKSTDSWVQDFMVIEYQEGMENWDIPYFEGMQSVKMPVLTTTGKNLFNPEWLNTNFKNCETVNGLQFTLNSDYTIKVKGTLTLPTTIFHPQNVIENLEDGMTYTSKGINCQITNFDGTKLWQSTFTVNKATQEKIEFYHQWNTPGEVIDEIYSPQIEYGTVATSYEPYKTNILTVNEEVELRGIGDFKDELNLITGELTENVKKMTLNGSENWTLNGTYSNFIELVGIGKLQHSTVGFCDKLPKVNIMVSSENNPVGFMMVSHDGIRLKPLEGNDNSLEDYKQWLKENPVTIYFLPQQKSIKTVDLTVQNQDGGTIPRIQTQPTITHVSTSSNGLSPVVEMSCSYDTIIKPNTTYTIKLDRPIVSDTMYLQVDLGGTMMMLDADVNAFTIKTPSTLSHSQLRLSGVGNTIKEIIVLEGNRVNDKIEYFEGMKNVENPILIVNNCPYVFGKGGRL